MTLTTHNQLRLLYDILTEQRDESFGDISEYQQIKRLVQSMIANDKIKDDELLQLLPEIYNYGRQGEIAQNDTEHILSNKENMTKWINAIQQISAESFV